MQKISPPFSLRDEDMYLYGSHLTETLPSLSLWQDALLLSMGS